MTYVVFWSKFKKKRKFSYIQTGIFAYKQREYTESGAVGGWMHHIFIYGICLSAGAVEWRTYCFATVLLHSAPKITSVLVLFVMFSGLFIAS